MRSRTERIENLKNNPEVSVLIIGAGINGIGTFRDLGLQGLDVVMIDREDYCSGASAASSHMVHGGIRYLENGEFKLVREAVQERNRLIENAPHLVKPLKTTFPIFRLFSGLFNAPLKFLGLLERPAERGAVVIKLGMMMYDLFTREQKTVPPHLFRNRKESLTIFPDLNPEIIYTGTYYDGSMHSPERIAIELIKDVVGENEKAIPLNYVSFVSHLDDTVVLKDEVSGEQISLKPKIVVNAAGPWIDLVNKSMKEETHYISGTKGSHLILDHPELHRAIGDNEFFFENKDGRIVLIFPIQDRVMIGTSDLRVDDPDGVVITDEEIDYFFEMIARVFPKIEVNRSQIVYSFSGVRPLQHSEKGSTGQISRNHKIGVDEPAKGRTYPVLSLIGGKWTSFRAFSEQTADAVLERLGLQRKISTAELKIGGSKDLPVNESDRRALIAKNSENSGISPDRFERLLTFYGMQAVDMVKQYGETLNAQIVGCPQISEGEIVFILETEDVVHLDDLLLRRTLLGKLGYLTPQSLEEIAAVMARQLHWDDRHKENEIQRARQIFLAKHKVNLSS
jgi:glycerol-3-phosphate dehydrogenase